MTARGSGLRTAGAVALVAAVAGCGGPSAEETRADLRRWASAVDDICRATQEDLAARGGAQDVLDLDRVARRASDDVRAAIERIRRVPISDETRPRVRPFLAEVSKVEPRLSAMTRTTAEGDLRKIGDLGLRLADATRLLQDRAEAAELRACADKRQFDAVHDAFTAPVYATQIARFETWFVRKLRRLVSYDALTAPSFPRHLRRVSSAFDQASKRIDDMYTYLPNRAVEQADDLDFALEAYEDFLKVVADSLRGGRVLTPVGVKQFRREVAEQRREMRDALARLRTAIGAQPPGVRGAQSPEQDPA